MVTDSVENPDYNGLTPYVLLGASLGAMTLPSFCSAFAELLLSFG